MDSKLKGLIQHFMLTTGEKRKLSIARLIFLVYLADWKSSLECGHQITDLKWNGFMELTDQEFSFFKNLIETGLETNNADALDDDQKAIADSLSEVALLPWVEFEKVVQSTYPLFKYSDAQVLDLPALAQEYSRKGQLAS